MTHCIALLSFNGKASWWEKITFWIHKLWLKFSLQKDFFIMWLVKCFFSAILLKCHSNDRKLHTVCKIKLFRWNISTMSLEFQWIYFLKNQSNFCKLTKARPVWTLSARRQVWASFQKSRNTKGNCKQALKLLQTLVSYLEKCFSRQFSRSWCRALYLRLPQKERDWRWSAAAFACICSQVPGPGCRKKIF